MAALSQLTGIRLVQVPYRGAAPLLNDGTAGHVDMVDQFERDGRAAGEPGNCTRSSSSANKRASFIPETPTAVEQGITSLRAYSWFGFSARPARRNRHRQVLRGSRRGGARRGEPRHLHQQVPGRRAAATPEELRQIDRRGAAVLGQDHPDNNIKGGS